VPSRKLLIRLGACTLRPLKLIGPKWGNVGAGPPSLGIPPLKVLAIWRDQAGWCVVPESRGALSRDEDALWQEFYTATLRTTLRCEPSSNTAAPLR
jgi:hypothetical protein